VLQVATFVSNYKQPNTRPSVHDSKPNALTASKRYEGDYQPYRVVAALHGPIRTDPIRTGPIRGQVTKREIVVNPKAETNERGQNGLNSEPRVSAGAAAA
jgi:hypothetical protein